MIRELLLVRHGDAEFFGPDGSDASRRLTQHGRSDLERSYPKIFAGLKNATDVHLWVSPAVRAQETAAVIRDAARVPFASEDVHDSLYAQNDEAFLAELEAEGEGCVIAVGHIPFMERMLFELTGEHRSFGKGAVACISFVGGDLRKATLDWFAKVPKR